ncbi:MAG TPA: SGNH/GDSL hydrolase family protein [Terriglobales bacterium]|nr:SGNH/GDSL hydrolase family protein [Terriglobales bacterium]
MRRLRLLLLAIVVLSIPVSARTVPKQAHWVSAWSTAIHAPLSFPGAPPPPMFENQTIRMVVRPTIGGDRVRIRLSNAFGTDALTVGPAHIAISAGGAKIVADSDRTLTFYGKSSVKIPRGAPLLSDPVDLKFAPFAELVISIFVPARTPASSVHFWGQHESYISGPGDFTSKVDIADAKTSTMWYWLAGVEVWSSDQTETTVALGDSITDGVGAKQGDYSGWPDLLANRLSAQKGQPPMAVVNEGIGGNRILHDGAGVNALARLDRDVLSQPGVVNLIVLEGINDIGWPRMKPRMPGGEQLKEPPFAREMVSADEIIGGLKQIVERAHQHGIRVFGATLTPYEGADYYTVDGEEIRQAVNQWIRSSGTFDGVIDFDAAVRDPKQPSRFREGYHSGDSLHPSAAGFKAMADAIDLTMLRASSSAAAKK